MPMNTASVTSCQEEQPAPLQAQSVGGGACDMAIASHQTEGVSHEGLRPKRTRVEAEDGPDSNVRRPQKIFHEAGRTAATALKIEPGATPIESHQQGRGRRKYSMFLVPGDDREFTILPVARQLALDEKFLEKNGSAPREFEEVTAEQISAIAGRLELDECPYADFSIFGPFGRRTMKSMSARAQVFVGGELVTKAMTGPRSFEEWRKCWRVFRTALLKLDAALPGQLDAHEEGMRQLDQSHPQLWGHLSYIDDLLRSERWEVVRVLIEKQVAKGTYSGVWDERRP